MGLMESSLRKENVVSYKLVKGPLPDEPRHCLVTLRADGEFVDFGDWHAECEIPRVYIKATVVERAARELLGMVPAVEVEMLQERLARFEERLIEMEQVEIAMASIDAYVSGQQLPDTDDEEVSYGGSS